LSFCPGYLNALLEAVQGKTTDRQFSEWELISAGVPLEKVAKLAGGSGKLLSPYSLLFTQLSL
jgi:hypothetical protein